MIQTCNKIAIEKEIAKKRNHIEFLKPKKCYFHLTSSRCKSGEPIIEVGSHVKVGDIIGVRDGGFFKQNIHATISGIFVGIEKHGYRSGRKIDYMVIENDFEEKKSDRLTSLSDEEVLSLSKEDFIKKIEENSCEGLGGSGFPTFIKFKTPDKIDTVLLTITSVRLG